MGAFPSRPEGVRIRSCNQPGVTRCFPPIPFKAFPETRCKADGELITCFGVLTNVDEPVNDEYWLTDGQFLPMNDAVYVMTSAQYRARNNGAWGNIHHVHGRKVYKIDLSNETIEHDTLFVRGNSTYPTIRVFPHSGSIASMAADSINVIDLFKKDKPMNLSRARDPMTFARYKDFTISANGIFFGILSKSATKHLVLHIYNTDIITRPFVSINVTEIYKECESQPGHTHEFACVRFSPDGALIAVGMTCGQLAIFDWRKETGVCNVFEEMLTDSSLSNTKAFDFDSTSCHKILSVGGSDSCIYKIDCLEKIILDKVRLEGNVTVNILQYRYDFCRLIAALDNFVIQVYNGENLTLLSSINMKDFMQNLQKPPLSPYCPSITSMNVTTSGQQVALGTWNGKISVWQLPKVLDLRYLCKYRILASINIDHIQKLPLPVLLKEYLYSFPFRQ